MITIIFSIFGLLFLVLAVLTFMWPRTFVKMVDHLERRWSVDKDLFMKSALARNVIGIVFLIASVVLFYAIFAMKD